eukprot:SAG11_NODE_13959_length_631_cov_1.176692_1_plen_96_part_10
MSTCEQLASSKFGSIAGACAARPKTAVAVNVLCCLIAGLGFMNIETETKGDRLWVNQQSELKQQQEFIQEVFTPQPRVSMLSFTGNPTGGNVLTGP